MNEYNVIKQNNGICVTVDTNFASKSTCEEFLRQLLQILKGNVDTAELVSAETDVAYETNILPVPLMNLSQLSTDIVTNKQNYADDRADFEVRKFVAKFYDPADPSSAEFYDNYVKPIVDAVKKEFSNKQGGRSTMILCQTAFMRLSQTMVNILLMKKPDGTDNIIRRYKPKLDTRVVDENGNVSYSYYTPSEVATAETLIYNEYDAHNFISFDVGHNPFTQDYLLLSTASLISAERTERNMYLPVDEMTVAEIFRSDEIDTAVIKLNELEEILTSASLVSDRYHPDFNAKAFNVFKNAFGDNYSFIYNNGSVIHGHAFWKTLSEDQKNFIINIDIEKTYGSYKIGRLHVKYFGVTGGGMFNLDVLSQQFLDITEIATRDLEIIDIIEKRGGSIIDIIHADCKGIDVAPVADSNFLSMKEKYMTLLLYVRIILTAAEGLITRLNNLKKNSIGVSLSKLVGIEENNESYMHQLTQLLEDPDFSEFVGSIPFKFRISEHLFTVLLVNLVRRATVVGESGSLVLKAIELFSGMIGYRKQNLSSRLITNFFEPLDEVVTERAVENVSGLISAVEGRKESMVSYAYRNISKYMRDSGKFGCELAVIDSCIKIIEQKISSKRGAVPSRYSMLDNNLIFSIDALVDTVSHLTGIDTLNDSIAPFSTYKTELENKQLALDKRRKDVASKLDETYGKSFPRYHIQLPRIPYSISEQVWAMEKCVKLEAEISHITKFSSSFDWTAFRTAFRELDRLTKEFALSDIESPEMVADIQDAQEAYDELCNTCGLDDSYLNKIKSLEDSLNVYSNLDKMNFKFVPFDFGFKKGFGNTMDFHLGKTFILYNNTLRSVQSLVSNTDFVEILRAYFTPFFLPFAKINTDAFDISFNISYRENTKARVGMEQSSETITDVIMTVTYGSSDDTHVASKFRHVFPCILDTRRMIFEAKREMGIPEERQDFQVSDIDQKFIIRWKPTKEQVLAKAGSKGESVLMLVAKTRGCDESYPFYDNNGMRIVMNQYNYFAKRYSDMISIKKRREEDKKRQKEIEKRRKAGIKDEPKLMFGKESDQGKEQRERNAAHWSAKKFDGTVADATASMNEITLLNNQVDEQKETTRTPFGGKKFGDRRAYGDSGVNKRIGSLEITNDQPTTLAIQSYVKDREKVVKVMGPDGYFTYEKKMIKGVVRSQGYDRFQGYNRNSNQDRTRDRNRNSDTPKRFDRGLRNGERSGSAMRGRNTGGIRSGTPGNGRRGTPNGTKGTPTSMGNTSRSSTPSHHDRQRNGASPSAIKRSGYQPGAQSPAETSSSYLQPDHSSFINIQSSGLGFYPNSANSPIANEGRQIFQDIEPPSGVFIAPNRTSRTDGTDKSDRSAGTNLTGTSQVLTSTPQHFTVNDDDYDL